MALGPLCFISLSSTFNLHCLFSLNASREVCSCQEEEEEEKAFGPVREGIFAYIAAYPDCVMVRSWLPDGAKTGYCHSCP